MSIRTLETSLEEVKRVTNPRTGMISSFTEKKIKETEFPPQIKLFLIPISLQTDI